MFGLKKRLALELPHINAALARAAAALPAPVRPVAQHIFDAGGKRLRPFLTVLTARILGYKGKDIYDLAVSMEMLHAATLLHDDVLDEAVTRRGKAAAHTVFGITPTILAGDALLAAANQMVAEHGDVRLSACFSEATAQTAAGEILEIDYMRRVDQPAHIYDEVVRGKTAWLLRASCVMGALKAGADAAGIRAAADYGLAVGMAFQMVDDALDVAPEAATGKPTGGDLREGKLTPPIRLYREWLAKDDAPRHVAFDAAFAAGHISAEDAVTMSEEIRAQGFDLRTREMAGEWLRKALDALAQLPAAPERELLGQMADYIQNRNK